MSTAAIGRRAEDAAAAYLTRKGYRIAGQNWRTRWCEIDIVAVRGTAVTLVEVKYRRHNTWGYGLDYVTHAKQKQMSFAAEFWMARHQWTGECYLAAVEVSGPDYEVTEFIPEI